MGCYQISLHFSLLKRSLFCILMRLVSLFECTGNGFDNLQEILLLLIQEKHTQTSLTLNSGAKGAICYIHLNFKLKKKSFEIHVKWCSCKYMWCDFMKSCGFYYLLNWLIGNAWSCLLCYLKMIHVYEIVCWVDDLKIK